MNLEAGKSDRSFEIIFLVVFRGIEQKTRGFSQKFRNWEFPKVKMAVASSFFIEVVEATWRIIPLSM